MGSSSRPGLKSQAMDHHPPKRSGIVIFAYPRLGDFVRCHTLVQLLRIRFPTEPIDIVARDPAIALTPLMPEVRRGIVDPGAAGRLSGRQRLHLIRELRRARYRMAIVVSRGWKAALAPFLAGIPHRTGWFGEVRLGLINDLRFGEPRGGRVAVVSAMLGCERGKNSVTVWPAPRLEVPVSIMSAWRRDVLHDESNRPINGPVIVMAPGASLEQRRWPSERFTELAVWARRHGYDVWLLLGPAEQDLGQSITVASHDTVRVMTGRSAMDAACAVAAADLFVGNDSGPLHIAAGLGKPAVGIYGLTRSTYERPLNPHVRIAERKEAIDNPWHPQYWPSVDEVVAQIINASSVNSIRPITRNWSTP